LRLTPRRVGSPETTSVKFTRTSECRHCT